MCIVLRTTVRQGVVTPVAMGTKKVADGAKVFHKRERRNGRHRGNSHDNEGLNTQAQQ